MNTDEKVAIVLNHVKIMAKQAHRQADKNRAFNTGDYPYYRGQEDAYNDVVAMLESIVEGGVSE